MDDTGKLHEENQRLRRAVEELSVLNELACTIGALNNSEDVVRKILSRSLRAVNAEQGVVTLVEEIHERPMRTLVRTTVTSSEHTVFHFNKALLGWMVLNKKPIVLNRPNDDERFRGVKWGDAVRSVLCAPLLVRSSLKGVITVYNKREHDGFTDDDQRLLAIIGSQSAQVIENARLYEEERALLKMQRELDLASQIQTDLLPKGKIRIPGYDIAGATFPARTVGGDFFDFIVMEDRKAAVCLGDVAGKGLPAALLMANIQASLRSEAFLRNPADTCIERLNRQLYRTTGPEKFATVFYGVLDAANDMLSYCNAGQEPPVMLTRGGEVKRLDVGGTVVGAVDGLRFRQDTVAFEPGDLMLAYSDGINESMDEDMVQFGEVRLIRLLEENSELRADEIIEKIARAVKDHAGNAPQHDDVTALVVKRAIS